MRQFVRGALAATLLALTAGGLLADEVRTKSGKVYTGKILEANARQVRIKTKFAGIVTLPRRDVASVKYEESKEDVYEKKLAALDPKDAPAHFELAQWCKKQKLFKQYRAELRRVIEIVPDHEKARSALGFVRHDGEWVKKKELAKREKAARAAKKKAALAAKKAKKTGAKSAPTSLDEAMKARGLIQHDGKWVPKEIQKFVKRGLVLHDGEWLRPKDVEELAKERYPLGKKRWGDLESADDYHSDSETPWIVHGTGFELHSNAPREYVDKAKRWLLAFDEWLQRFFLGQRPGQRIKVILYADPADYNQNLEELRRASDDFAFHSGSIGGVYHPKFEAVTTYANDEWGQIFLGHGYGEAFCRAMIKSGQDHLWFTLGVGQYLGMGRTESEPFNVSWVSDLTKNRLMPLDALLGAKKLKGSGSGGNYAADLKSNEAFYAQSAALVYVMLRDKRFAPAFKTIREKILAGTTPSEAVRGGYDLAVLEQALRKRIDVAAAIKDLAK